jgi:glycine cleavage system H protein
MKFNKSSTQKERVMKFPEELKYTKDHEWALVKGNQVTIGITDHAQQALGDVVYIELPKEGRILRQGEAFGVVESIKAVSDLYAPVAGRVIQVNTALNEDPSQINRDPYMSAWMIRIEIDPLENVNAPMNAPMNALMNADSYSSYVAALK